VDQREDTRGVIEANVDSVDGSSSRTQEAGDACHDEE
jgi:hypothetical protein